MGACLRNSVHPVCLTFPVLCLPFLFLCQSPDSAMVASDPPQEVLG